MPRRPEHGVLHRTLREHLETFLAEARARSDGDGLPRFVERELREFLSCGVLARGFARFRCDGCGHEILVAFSCKGRGFCPSCCGRRMAELAAHLTDHVLGGLPVRQWVLTLPHRLRYALAWDHRRSRFSCTGHTHIPSLREVDRRYIINTGSWLKRLDYVARSFGAPARDLRPSWIAGTRGRKIGPVVRQPVSEMEGYVPSRPLVPAIRRRIAWSPRRFETRTHDYAARLLRDRGAKLQLGDRSRFGPPTGFWKMVQLDQ